MIAAAFVQFTGWMALGAIGVAVIGWAGMFRERRRAMRMFEEVLAAQQRRDRDRTRGGL